MVLKSNTDLLLFVTPNAIGKEEKSATFYRLNIFIIQLIIFRERLFLDFPRFPENLMLHTFALFWLLLLRFP